VHSDGFKSQHALNKSFRQESLFMTIKRTVINIKSDDPKQSREFYEDFLGFEVAMDMDEIITFASPSHPTVQLSVVRPNQSGAPHPIVSIEVTNVDEIHAKAITQGIKIVYPLTDEPWGVRRFFIIDPNGVVINVLSHC
jgi:catechol 2,3-dioxygenase-like lactoylglutathione lyase family enzyme